MQLDEEPTYWEQPPRRSTGTIVLLVLVLLVTLINLGLTVYVFMVTREIVQFGEELKAYFGG